MLLRAVVFVQFCLLFSSCYKFTDKKTAIRETFELDSVYVEGYDNIRVVGKVDAFAPGVDIQKYITWTYPGGGIYTITIPTSGPRFDTVIKTIGQHSAISVRASYNREGEAYYSKAYPVTTGGLAMVWHKELPGDDYTFQKMLMAADGGLVLLQQRDGPSNTTYAGVTKFDTNGMLMWTKKFHENQPYAPQDFIPFAGGYVLASRHVEPNGSQLYLTRLTDQGEVLWEKSFAGIAHNEYIALQALDNTQLSLYARSYDTMEYRNSPRRTAYLINWSIGADGSTTRRQQALQLNSFTKGSAIIYGAVSTTGHLTAFSQVGEDQDLPVGSELSVHHFDRLALNWEKVIGDPDADRPFGLCLSNAGNPVILAWNEVWPWVSSSPAKDRLRLAEIDQSTAQTLWETKWEERFISPAVKANPTALYKTQESTFLVTGSVWNSFRFSAPILLKFSQSGQCVWEYKMMEEGHKSSNRAEAVVIAADGAIYLAGGYNTSDQRISWLRKLRP